MRTMFSKNTLAAFFSIALAFTFSCSNSDDPGDGGSQIVIYIGISGGNEYVLKIDSPKTGESYTLTVGGKTSTGTVSSFTNETFTLKPSNSETPFTATISGSNLTAMGGTITWNDNTTSQAPSELTPPSTSGSSSSNGSGDGNYTDKGNNISSYSTKTIGEQTWMAENLNYNVTGSKCYGEDGRVQDPNSTSVVATIELSPTEIQSNCNKYGRMYDWATAMALPSKCIEVLSTSDADCAIGSPHRGICPSGWHIPSHEDWDKLYRFADGTNGTSSHYSSGVAGARLKATSGWDDCGPSGSGSSYLCQDSHGFSALPGGGYSSKNYATSYYNYSSIGIFSMWWSSSEYNSLKAYNRAIHREYTSAITTDADKYYLLSVRCVKD